MLPTGPLTFDRLADEIAAQSALLAGVVAQADLAAPVPSCPGWTINAVTRHLGGGLRWAAEIVRTRATAPPDDRHFRDVDGHRDDPVELAVWLTDSGAALTAALREAGPDAELWVPVPGATTASFYARRFAHETLVHRADATLAAGAQFTVDEAVAVDAVDEWFELGTLPVMLDVHPRQRELLGPGRTVHLHATDASAAEWVLDLTGDVMAWRHAHEKCAVAVRGPVAELLLVLYRRRSRHDGTVEVIGDVELLDFWLDRVGFG